MHGLFFLIKLPYKLKTRDRRLPLPPSAVLSQQAGSMTPAYTTPTWGVTASSSDVQNTPCCRACPPLQELPATLTRLQVSFLLGRTRDNTSLPRGGALTPVPPESYRALKDLSARKELQPHICTSRRPECTEPLLQIPSGNTEVSLQHSSEVVSS